MPPTWITKRTRQSDELARTRLSEATRRFAASTFDMERYVERLDRLGVAHSDKRSALTIALRGDATVHS
jgi:hypothetical protein